ncbi:hypothetical protein T492DRAFT_880418, partial [Pavlovales sp. CCMP2436]
VSTYDEASACLHHAVHLCNLLANQKAALNHTYARRAALIGHIFTQSLPLPLPLPPNPKAVASMAAGVGAGAAEAAALDDAASATGCFWRQGPY